MTEQTQPTPLGEPGRPGSARVLRRGRSRRADSFFGGMRVRKKVLFLHTLFSLGLAAVLLLPLRPAITGVVEQAEVDEAKLALRLVLAHQFGDAPAGGVLADEQWRELMPGARIRAGTARELGLSDAAAERARATPGTPISALIPGQETSAVAFIPGSDGPDSGRFLTVAVRIPEARRAVSRLYIFTAVALLALYALVAAALELFVLPQHVYGPIGRMLDADLAVQEGNKDQEIIPDAVIPADELGEIMKSRNGSILALRRHERALAEALAELERVATDLKRKNHLLEAARRNLADADRLASLGMMSAGIAHELNTPLAVVKGLAERLNSNPRKGLDPAQAALMLRVVHRLERLGESLLDFARVRPPHSRPVDLRSLVDEAATLVRLDRDTRDIEFINNVPMALTVECDGDRMVQVMVNLLRNSADAIRSQRAAEPAAARPSPPSPAWEPDGEGAPQPAAGRVQIDAETSTRDGHEWVSLTVTDSGPGIDRDLLSRLFEPFASTRLDAHGTGLGLAVAEGIVREHGGLILARNRTAGTGAVFEVMLPVHGLPYPQSPETPAVPRLPADPAPSV